MRKQNELINKVKHLLKKCNAPRHLHHFGPKLYQLWQHVFALFIKAECQFSYRRTTTFLRNLGFEVATKSTLQRYAAKLKIGFWQEMFYQTISKVSGVVCLDGTGLSRTKASEHYVHRIDAKRPFCKGYHLSILVGEDSKILNFRIRQKYCHDIKDVKYLFKNLPNKPKIVLMDKGYDSEKLHRYFKLQNIWSIAPVRKNCVKGQLRKKLRDDFPQKLYNKRNRVESVFHALNQKYGNCVNSQKIVPARSEIYCRVILYNLFLRIIQFLGQTQHFRKVYILLRVFSWWVGGILN
ncbi:transposase [Nanoarchaeota archaeon]